MAARTNAEQWAALRILKEGATPTYALLAVIAEMNPSHLRARAAREGWGKGSVALGRAGTRLRKGLAGRGSPAAGEGCATQRADGDADLKKLGLDTGDAADGNAVLLAEVEGVLAQAQAGRVEKARVDAVLAMIRMVERSQQFRRPAEAANKKTRSDDELAGLLARIDARIVELARAYAERLGRGECSDNAG